jgi:hypothetical protein
MKRLTTGGESSLSHIDALLKDPHEIQHSRQIQQSNAQHLCDVMTDLRLLFGRR